MNLDSINESLTVLDKIQGLSAAGLVFFSCIVAGYALKFIRQFPNRAIPVAVILMGALFMLLLADGRPTEMGARVWTVRNFLAGLVIGFCAWMCHYFIIYRIENWIVSKFPPKGFNTEQIQKPLTPGNATTNVAGNEAKP